MTKVYVVLGHSTLLGTTYVSLVFTNYAKAQAYCNKMNEMNEDFTFWIEEKTISKVDFRKLPY